MTKGDKQMGLADCTRCNGTGWYQYDRNHSTICPDCCPCDQGWWLLVKHYGERNGMYCCKRGCGKTLWPSDLGIDVPGFIAPEQFRTDRKDGHE